MRAKTLLPLCLLLALAGLSAGCDEASPVAPEGSILSITANPTTVGLNGSSTIIVVGRKPDGNPLNPGTEVRFSTDLGTIEPIAEVGPNGRATATFTADRRSGDASITASVGVGGGGGGEGGAGTNSATVTVQVGESEATRPSVLVSVNPNNIPVEGRATVTVIARNPDGSPVGAGQEVILTTTLGRLRPSRPVTEADGTATSTLDAGSQAGTTTITAIVGSSEPATADVTIRDSATDISLQANPSNVPRSGGTVQLTAFVTNSQGQPLQGAPVTFEAERGTLQTNGVVFTNTSGVASNTLTVSQEQVENVTRFEVEARTPDGTGQILRDSSQITVN